MSGFTTQGGKITKVGIWVGDVITYQGKRYKVLNEKRVNWLIQDESGKQYNLRIGSAGAVKAEDQTWNGPAEKTEYQKYMESVEAGITLGTAVILSDNRLVKKYGAHTYVVIAMPSNGTLRLAKLGGADGQYLRNITASQLTVVEADRIA